MPASKYISTPVATEFVNVLVSVTWYNISDLCWDEAPLNYYIEIQLDANFSLIVKFCASDASAREIFKLKRQKRFQFCDF